jgi:hypothetical protein
LDLPVSQATRSKSPNLHIGTHIGIKGIKRSTYARSYPGGIGEKRRQRHRSGRVVFQLSLSFSQGTRDGSRLKRQASPSGQRFSEMIDPDHPDDSKGR